MAASLPKILLSPSSPELFGQLLGEMIRKVSPYWSKLVVHIHAKGAGALPESIRNLWVEKVQQGVAVTLFALGTLYNVKQSPLFFALFLPIGLIASSCITEAGKKRERHELDRPVFPLSAKEGYLALWAIGFITFLNKRIGDTYLDNWIFAAVTSLICGNFLWHHALKSQEGARNLLLSINNYSPVRVSPLHPALKEIVYNQGRICAIGQVVSIQDTQKVEISFGELGTKSSRPSFPLSKIREGAFVAATFSPGGEECMILTGKKEEGTYPLTVLQGKEISGKAFSNGELFGLYLGTLVGFIDDLITKITTKITSGIPSPSMRDQDKESLAKVIYFLSALYHMKQAPLFFLASFGVSFIASTEFGKFTPLTHSKILKKWEIFPCTKEESYMGAKLMLFTAMCNRFFGSSYVEDWSWAIVMGTLAGNNASHHGFPFLRRLITPLHIPLAFIVTSLSKKEEKKEESPQDLSLRFLTKIMEFQKNQSGLTLRVKQGEIEQLLVLEDLASEGEGFVGSEVALGEGQTSMAIAYEPVQKKAFFLTPLVI